MGGRKSFDTARTTKLKHLGRYPDLDTFIREVWELGYLESWDANDMITLLDTWQTGDVSLVRDGGDLQKCLGAIKARGLIMPSKTDLYFPVWNLLRERLPRLTLPCTLARGQRD